MPAHAPERRPVCTGIHRTPLAIFDRGIISASAVSPDPVLCNGFRSDGRERSKRLAGAGEGKNYHHGERRMRRGVATGGGGRVQRGKYG